MRDIDKFLHSLIIEANGICETLFRLKTEERLKEKLGVSHNASIFFIDIHSERICFADIFYKSINIGFLSINLHPYRKGDLSWHFEGEFFERIQSFEEKSCGCLRGNFNLILVIKLDKTFSQIFLL